MLMFSSRTGDRLWTWQILGEFPPKKTLSPLWVDPGHFSKTCNPLRSCHLFSRLSWQPKREMSAQQINSRSCKANMNLLVVVRKERCYRPHYAPMKIKSTSYFLTGVRCLWSQRMEQKEILWYRYYRYIYNPYKDDHDIMYHHLASII